MEYQEGLSDEELAFGGVGQDEVMTGQCLSDCKEEIVDTPPVADSSDDLVPKPCCTDLVLSGKPKRLFREELEQHTQSDETLWRQFAWDGLHHF